jgi:hypothetical protein
MDQEWIKGEILSGFQKLITLSLEHPPAAEVLPGTVLAWLEAITAGRVFDQDRDAPRFRAAFLALATRCRRWPVPADFLEALPSPQAARPTLRLIDEHSRQRGRAHLADIAKQLNIGGEA